MSIDSALTGDSGVALVRYQAQSLLRWLVRELPTHDYGVDAEAERIDGNDPTGQLIGLQIKSGNSYFAEATSDGWVYRPSQRHVTYWTNHTLPIFVVFVNLETETAYWQFVAADTLRSVGPSSWKMLVPKANELRGAAAAWSEAAESNDREAVASFEANLEILPPFTATGLRKLHEDLPILSSRLAKSLAAQDAREAAERLTQDSPSWLASAPYSAWQVISSFCADHEFFDLATNSLLRASSFSDNPLRADNLANAALLASHGSAVSPRDLLNEAQQIEGSNYLVAIADALLFTEGNALPDLGSVPSGSRQHVEAAMHAYRRERAARDGDLNEALLHGERASRLSPDNTTYALVNAALRLRRSSSDQAGVDDLGVAAELGERVFAARRIWRGPLLEPCTTVITAHLLQHNNSAVGRWVTPAPEGHLPDSLANEPGILEYRFKHYLLSGSFDAAEEVAANVTDPLLRAKMDADLLSTRGTTTDQATAWRRVAALAQAAEDHNRLASASLRLAMLGRLDTATLRAVESTAALPESQLNVIKAIDGLNAGETTQERTLRRLADGDATAAEALIEYYATHGRQGEAAAAAERAAERLRNPMFLVRLIDLLQQHGQPGDALRTAQRLLMDTRVRGAARMSALRVIVTDASDRGDWSAAEAWCNQGLEVASAADRTAWAWRLIITQLNQRAADRAFESYQRFRPDVRNVQEAELWLRVHQARAWDAEIITQALDVEVVAAAQADVSGAILLRALRESSQIEGESEDDESPPYRARFQAQLQLHIDRHGAAGGISQIQGTTDELIEYISGMAQLRANALGGIHRQVAHGQIPFGLLASAAGRPYSVSLALGAAPLVAGTLDEEAFDREVEAATATIDAAVVIGLEALYVTSLLDASDEVLGLFGKLIISRSARDDLSAGLADARQDPASESIVWREETDELVRVPSDPAAHASALLSLQKMDAQASRMELEQPRSTLFRDLDQPAIQAWSSAIQLAKESGRPLWTDDRIIRQLCDDLGVANFGTLALLEAAAGLTGCIEPEEVIFTLASRNIVDLPVTAAFWRDWAAREGFAPRSAALMTTRASFWAWLPGIQEEVREVMVKAEEAHPGSARYWRRSAMIGIARSQTEANAPEVLMKFALFGAEAFIGRSLAATIVEGIQDARWVAQHLNVSDPYAHFDSFVSEMLGSSLTLSTQEELRAQVQRLLLAEESPPAGPEA